MHNRCRISADIVGMTFALRPLFAACVVGVGLLTGLPALTACDPAPPQGPGLKVASLSKEAITIGETLYMSGHGFLPPSEGRNLVEFAGIFYWTDDDGTLVPEDVPAFTIAPIYDGEFPEGGSIGGMDVAPGARVLRWNRFGPYVGPFGGDGRRTGTFKGTVTVITEDLEGRDRRGEPTVIALEIRPSVLITKLEPVLGATDDGALESADCQKPALRVFGGIPYVMQVETMGFQPEYFLYEMGNINGDNGFTSFTHPATSIIDRLGDPTEHPGEMVVFNQLSDDVDFALASIRVVAVDANNDSIETAMPVPVVRPVRIQYDGNRQLAEYYEPVPVHGPIVGGIGTEVTYSESTSESRQNAVSVTFTESTLHSTGTEASESWSDGYTVGSESSQTGTVESSISETTSSSESYGTEYTHSDETSVQLGSETGTEWGWSLVEGETQESYNEEMNHLFGTASTSFETQVGGEASIPGLGGVSGHVGNTTGASVENGRETTSGSRTGASRETGASMGGSQSESTVYGSTTSDGVSESISGTYGVENQSSINTARSTTEATNESVTYEMGGGSSVSEGYEVGSQTAWEESWVTTTEQTNLLQFSGRVPNGRCAMIYRQTVRYVRTAEMYTYDLCGVRSTMGELTFNEWSWSPNIAIGDDCETSVPPSTQPKAQCFHACD